MHDSKVPNDGERVQSREDRNWEADQDCLYEPQSISRENWKAEQRKNDLPRPRRKPAKRSVPSRDDLAPVDDEYEARLRANKQAQLDPQPYTEMGSDSIRSVFNSQSAVTKMLATIGVNPKDIERAFAGKPFRVTDRNQNLLSTVTLYRDTNGMYELLRLRAKGEKGKPAPCTLGAVHAVRVLCLSKWPHVFPSWLDVRLWSGRLAIEAGVVSVEDRTPLPLLDDPDFVRAVTRIGGREKLLHAVVLCDALALRLDVQRHFLKKMHGTNNGSVQFAPAFRQRWLPREVMERLTPGNSCFTWGALRTFGYVDMRVEKSDEDAKPGPGRPAGLYKLNPEFQQKKYNLEEAVSVAEFAYPRA